jgi:hypothetical protein
MESDDEEFGINQLMTFLFMYVLLLFTYWSISIVIVDVSIDAEKIWRDDRSDDLKLLQYRIYIGYRG